MEYKKEWVNPVQKVGLVYKFEQQTREIYQWQALQPSLIFVPTLVESHFSIYLRKHFKPGLIFVTIRVEPLLLQAF